MTPRTGVDPEVSALEARWSHDLPPQPGQGVPVVRVDVTGSNVAGELEWVIETAGAGQPAVAHQVAAQVAYRYDRLRAHFRAAMATALAAAGDAEQRWVLRVRGDADDIASGFADLGHVDIPWQQATATGWRLYNGRDLETEPATAGDLWEWIRVCLDLPVASPGLRVTPTGPDEVVVQVACPGDLATGWARRLVPYTGPGSITLVLDPDHPNPEHLA